ncbi:hypothetical protein H5410_062270 [Solanum commersonii]|uniref:Uncharacterized protein n=1 Tax=Solanum commersonii TaxID=4109 RepID=A0A9J5WBS8_SOLCO|nr:hypothetical protein H5410_062270 [Solanum commersonii]
MEGEDTRKGPDLIEKDDEVLQHRKDTKEDEDIEYNIQQISKAGDLSPRHTNSLKYGARKVYARCTALERLELWEELEELARSEHYSWVVGGILVNQEFQDILPTSKVHHLIRQGSDHASLQMICNSAEGPTIKHFRFLNFWSKHKHFKKIVEDNWCVDFIGNPFVEFQEKLKKIKKGLSSIEKKCLWRCISANSHHRRCDKKTMVTDFAMLEYIPKCLTEEENEVLIYHVLQSMSIYLLSAMNPTKKVMEQIHQIFAKFFWGRVGGVKGKYRVAWEDMCLPKEEGGIGFRRIQDINKALFTKLWWNFRISTNSLWAEYMWNKQGALYFTEGDTAQEEELEVKDFIRNKDWDVDKLRSVIYEEMVHHITTNFKARSRAVGSDKA